MEMNRYIVFSMPCIYIPERVVLFSQECLYCSVVDRTIYKVVEGYGVTLHSSLT